MCHVCSIVAICLARWLNPIANCVNKQDGARTFVTHCIIVQSATSPGLWSAGHYELKFAPVEYLVVRDDRAEYIRAIDGKRIYKWP